MKTPTIPTASAVGVAALLTLAACAPAESGSSAASTTSPTASAESHDHAASESEEQAVRTPRLVATYDGGVAIIDANSLDVVSTIDKDGFLRVAAVGDGRHATVATDGGWTVLDAGTWSQGHGDHYHYYTAEPMLTDLTIDAETPGHVVPHEGTTTLWDDATGHATVVEISEWTDMAEHAHLHPIREYTAPEAHHGVAAVTEDGQMLVTRGNEDERTGAMVLAADGAEMAVSDECPGVHGETGFRDADDEHFFMVGCEDGALVFHGDHVHKIVNADSPGRTGSLFSSEGSSVVLGDFNDDPDAGLGLDQIALYDVASESVSVVKPFGDADALYTFRGIRRGSDGEALVLGSDGVLRTIDPATGEVTVETVVIDAWDVPEEWQTAHPSLTVVDGMAYVTDPATESLHIVDYVAGEVWKSAEVGVALNEVTAVTG
ncbi:hypothetical protein [Demequina sediminicola]|uniref:hypothetical protein n=1 Tax=Demequina sediminicola TaxID=1095026 RepID=UPI00078581BB|nr:hypothetical protein [Demequina sediminicola]